MHQKKRKLHKLHSIPIGLCNNRKRLHLVSYSIPLSCMVVLLLGFTMMIKTCSSYNYDRASAADDDAGISSHINVAHPEISMTVSNETGDGYGSTETGQVTTAPGAGTAYRSHKITISGTDIQDYQLMISGPTNLTPSSGATTVISGAEGKTGEEMSRSDSNIWGYAWGDNTDDVTSMAYNTVVESGRLLDCTDPNADFTVNCEKKLVFGANFATGADGGTYTANVTVSLTSTPHLVGQAWSDGKGFSLDTGIDDMKDIDRVEGGFCRASIPSGSTVTLRDNRGGVENFYKIIKMDDGTCWMAENLRLINATIDSTDSDMTSGSFTVPTSDLTNFGSYMNTNDGLAPHAYYNNDTIYGAYYNWYTATAGAGDDSVSGGDVNTSICPKGWKLPAYEGTGSFYNIIDGTNGYKSLWLSSDTGTAINGYNGYRLGHDSNDAFWPAAGNVHHRSLGATTSNGDYWSRRANSSDDAYHLYFSSNGSVNSQGTAFRYFGYPVRCVAEADTGVWTTPSKTEVPTSVKTMQGVTKADFTDKYCANNATANALVPVGSTINLKDSRDGNIYTIVKLSDSKCWMQQNLRLNLTKNTIIQGSTSSGAAYNWVVPNLDTATTQVYTTFGTWTSNNSTVMSRAGSGTTGNYYTWCAATAGTCTDAASDGVMATASICPKGWKLPTGSASGDFYNLFGNAGINLGGSTNNSSDDYRTRFNNIQASPYSFTTAGGVLSNGTLDNVGSGGLYWSGTAGSDVTAYRLTFGSDFFYPGTHKNARCYGFSVRCVAR